MAVAVGDRTDTGPRCTSAGTLGGALDGTGGALLSTDPAWTGDLPGEVGELPWGLVTGRRRTVCVQGESGSEPEECEQSASPAGGAGPAL